MMDNESHIWLVDAEAEGVGGNNNLEARSNYQNTLS
jgi:hypothetical protein